MQTATIMLALGGDQGNTIQKYGITPAEVAVLMRIHGDGAVFDIKPGGNVKRSSREELARLREIYTRNTPNGNHAPEVDALFPGVAARVFETFDEMGLDGSLYAAKERVKPTDGISPDLIDKTKEGGDTGGADDEFGDMDDEFAKANDDKPEGDKLFG